MPSLKSTARRREQSLASAELMSLTPQLPQITVLPNVPPAFVKDIKSLFVKFPPPLLKRFIDAAYPIVITTRISDAYSVQTGEALSTMQAIDQDDYGAIFIEPVGKAKFTPYIALSSAQKLQQYLKPYLFHELAHALLQIDAHFDNSREVVLAYESDCRVQSRYFLNKRAKRNPFSEQEQLIQNYYFPSVEKKCSRHNLSHLSREAQREVRTEYRATVDKFHQSGSIAYARREAAADVLAYYCGASLYSSGVFHIDAQDFIARSFPSLAKVIRSRFASSLSEVA